MANRTLFNSIVGRLLAATPAADTRNEAGGLAYARSSESALAQYAATGCLNTTFYATDETQLATLLELASSCAPRFVAQTALFARRAASMKDAPALLCAHLASRDGELLERVFPRVIDSARMLRTFVQIVRSGATGRRSLGSRPRRLVRAWLERRDERTLLAASVGTEPSLADVVRMTHPAPSSPVRAAFYGWLIGRPVDATLLPECVRELEAFLEARRAGGAGAVPDVPFALLTSVALRAEDWARIARTMPWQALRQALNTLVRQGAFDIAGVADDVARRLADPALVRSARVLPYQLMTAVQALAPGAPEVVRTALESALETALENVPEIPGRIAVGVDTSGSMSSPVTGHRRGATTVVRCVDVAALVASALAARNPGTEILPFDTRLHSFDRSSAASIVQTAAALARLGGGGTECSIPLRALNERRAHVDLVVIVSDNQSWVRDGAQGRTAVMEEWTRLKARCPRARLACIDLQPIATTQALGPDVLNVGGFSDAVFTVLGLFARGQLGAAHWLERIEREEV